MTTTAVVETDVIEAGVVPNVTDVTPASVDPSTVTVSPPLPVPVGGVTPVTIGGDAYVNPLKMVVFPAGDSTVTFTVPAVLACVFTLRTLPPVPYEVMEAAVPPNVTLVTLVRCVPWIAMSVPPVVEPNDGVVRVAVGGISYVNPDVSTLDVPRGVTTFTPTDPTRCELVVTDSVVPVPVTAPIVANEPPNVADEARVK
jgi:hypothetical protein